jgi:7-carboxy-7-deazaguanine synthase
MKVTEIYKSIQGESTYMGLPSVFIRLTGCNLRCKYCDTKYAYEGGKELHVNDIINIVNDYRCKIIEITGGEPLLQGEVYLLSEKLIKNGYKVLIETNGTISIKRLNREIIKIMDIKCPSSGMSDKMDFNNIDLLEKKDEVKFVISDYNDYIWSVNIIKKFELEDRCNILFSPVFRLLEPKEIAGWILRNNLNVRLQIQLHKYIWGKKEGLDFFNIFC